MRVTARELNAASSAIAAMLAGEEHAGDWPEDVDRTDLQSVLDKLQRDEDDDETRSRTLRIRLTEAERATLDEAAEHTGQSRSEYARRRIFK